MRRAVAVLMRPGSRYDDSTSGLAGAVRNSMREVTERTLSESSTVHRDISTSLREGALVRFSRPMTHGSCHAAHTVVISTTRTHQNCHSTPHNSPGSPRAKGQEIEVRGHRKHIQSQGALRESTPPSIDRVPARPLAAKPLPKPFSACMIRAESNFNRINPSRSGRERSVSKSSLMAWRQHSGVTRLRAADVSGAVTRENCYLSFGI